MMVVILKMMAIVTFTLYNQRMILKIRSTSSIMIRWKEKIYEKDPSANVLWNVQMFFWLKWFTGGESSQVCACSLTSQHPGGRTEGSPCIPQRPNWLSTELHLSQRTILQLTSMICINVFQAHIKSELKSWQFNVSKSSRHTLLAFSSLLKKKLPSQRISHGWLQSLKCFTGNFYRLDVAVGLAVS